MRACSEGERRGERGGEAVGRWRNCEKGVREEDDSEEEPYEDEVTQLDFLFRHDGHGAAGRVAGHDLRDVARATEVRYRL